MVQARGTTRETAALLWGAKRPRPFSISGSVVMRKECLGSVGTSQIVQSTFFVRRLTPRERREFQQYGPL
eukprot:11943873-Ditylum_brightwellii.AAC.1